jgi:hypothetical protein
LPEAVALSCDGACEEHQGVVKTVHVGNGVFDWGNYNYCGAAVAEDRRRGLIVTEVAA